MRKILLNLAVSLDGFIEGPGGDYSWCMTDQDYGMQEFLDRVDTIFFGRKSWEVLAGTVKKPYLDKEKYVFSTTLAKAPPGVRLIRENAASASKDLKSLRGKDIWLFGGAELFSFLLRAGIVDELHLSVHPVILGGGKPLFTDGRDKKNLRLLGAQVYGSGLVQVVYGL
jgi:dihydrofolate reductase